MDILWIGAVWLLILVSVIGDNMTRCKMLDGWFDVQSKRLDEAEKKEKKDLVTGKKA